MASTVAYSDKLANDKFDASVGFAIDGSIKDTTFVQSQAISDPVLSDMYNSHIRRLAEECNSPMPVIDTAHQHLLTARAIHTNQKREGRAIFDTLDVSGIIAGPRVAAGLNGFDNQKVQRIESPLSKCCPAEMFCSTPPLSEKTDRESVCFPPVLREARMLVVAFSRTCPETSISASMHVYMYVPYVCNPSSSKQLLVPLWPKISTFVARRRDGGRDQQLSYKGIFRHRLTS